MQRDNVFDGWNAETQVLLGKKKKNISFFLFFRKGMRRSDISSVEVWSCRLNTETEIQLKLHMHDGPRLKSNVQTSNSHWWLKESCYGSRYLLVWSHNEWMQNQELSTWDLCSHQDRKNTNMSPCLWMRSVWCMAASRPVKF